MGDLAPEARDAEIAALLDEARKTPFRADRSALTAWLVRRDPEHHDLATIPWNRLPELRRAAPEFYDELAVTRSYVGLALKFVFGNGEDFNNEEYRNRQRFATPADAIGQCFTVLSKKQSASWILEGDIRACLDHTS